jgi:ribonuclease E
VDSQAGVKRVKQHLMNWSGGRSPQGVFIDYHRERQPILEYYRVNAAIREALKPRVELPSGGYIIIEPTEALTVIDVNSGSFTRSATARETVLWTNREAATEIARQLRLRNIGGVIVVDFIDMDSRRDQLKLLEHFNQTLKGDKARPQIAQLSELGLVELTRKRQGKNIYELFGQTCHTCGGLGQLAHLPGKSVGESLEGPPITPPAVALQRNGQNLLGNFDELEPEFVESFESAGYERNTRSLEPIERNNDRDSGAAGGNRRRRRRSDLLMKDELNETTPATVTPNREIEKDNERYVAEERKPRERSRDRRRDEANLAKVSVEMTELEQEICALMGISPLVFSDRDIKDAKSVLVYVTTPGEASPIEATESVETIERTPKSSKPALVKKAAAVTIEPEVQPEAQPEIQPEPIIEAPPAMEAEDSEETNSGRRRRRRRSSAPTEASV